VIKRNYFISARIHNQDGGYACRVLHTTRKSWFDESEEACRYAMNKVMEYADELGVSRDRVEFICFTRC